MTISLCCRPNCNRTQLVADIACDDVSVVTEECVLFFVPICSSFAPVNFISSLEIDTNDQQVQH